MENEKRKLNYLLTQNKKQLSNDELDLIKWLRENQDNLKTLIDIKNILENENVTINDLIKQIEYGNEYRALVKFEQEYKAMHNDGFIGTTPGTFIFENTMRHELHSKFNKINDTVPMIDATYYGVLLIPLPTVKIKNTKTDEYFTSHGVNSSITVIQNDIGPLVKVGINGIKFTLQGKNAEILGMQQLSTLIQQRLLVLPYLQTDYGVKIHSLEATINPNETNIVLKLSESRINLTPNQFQQLADDIPRGVKAVWNIFATDFDDYFLPFKKLYIATLLQELVPQITDYYEQAYGNNLTYGLFGQGAAVSISQLYNLATSTIRREEVEYELKTAQPITQTISNVEPFPEPAHFATLFPFTQQQVWAIQNVDKPGFEPDPICWRWENFPVKLQQAKVVNNHVYLTESVNLERSQIPKIKIEKRTGENSSIAEAWVEHLITSVDNIHPISGKRNVFGVDSGYEYPIGDYFIDGIAGGKLNQDETGYVEFYGLNLLVRNRNKGDYSFDLKLTYTYVAHAIVETQLVLMPDDLSSESTSTMEGTITWSYNGEEKTQNILLSPKRIKYGTGERNAYVGKLQEMDRSITFNVINSVQFSVGTPIPHEGASYASQWLTDYIVNNESYAFRALEGEIAIAWGGTRYNVPLGFKTKPGVPLFKASSALPLNPPFCWHDWGNSKELNFDFHSAYLSVSNKIPSVVLSPLSMIRDAINFKRLPGVSGGIINPGTLCTDDNLTHIITKVKPLHLSAFENRSGLDFSPITGWKNDFRLIDGDLIIKNLDLHGIELILPEGIYNQFSLSESITDLQTGVAFLSIYADYLKYLMDNLSERVTIVEKTMEEVIQTMNEIITAITPKKPSIGSQILSFLGTAVGMFFPLTGLAISIVGQIYEGVEQLRDGNITAGVMDITTGCLMSALGVRKFKQRMDRKYGAQKVDISGAPSRLPTYDELYGPPGYNAIETEIVGKKTSNLKTSSGVIKSATAHYNERKVEVETIMLQQGIYDSFKTSRSLSDNSVIMAKVTEAYDYTLGNGAVMTYRLVRVEYDEDNNLIETDIPNSVFQNQYSTKITLKQFVKYMFMYANLGTQVSEGVGFDEEVLTCIAISNFSNDNKTTRRLRNQNYYNVFTIIDQTQKNRSAFSLSNDNTSPISLNDFARAVDPFINDVDQQINIYNNVYGYMVR